MNKKRVAGYLPVLWIAIFSLFSVQAVNAEVILDSKKCINVGNALDAPKEGDWGVTIHDYYFDDIVKAGFDTVRLPVRWDSHLNSSNVINADFMARVKEVVDQALSRNLKVIIDVHHFTKLSEDASEDNIETFYSIWTQISKSFSSYSDDELMFELLNEPRATITVKVWNNLLKNALTIIRQTNPTRKVLVGGTTYNTTGSLSYLDLDDIDKSNLVATFHYYLPIDFTHQGYSWVETTGTFDSSDRAYAITRFMAAKSWAMKQRIPLLVGEFGVSRFATTGERATYLKFITSLPNSINATWCVWSLADGFRFYDTETRTFDETLLNALGL